MKFKKNIKHRSSKQLKSPLIGLAAFFMFIVCISFTYSFSGGEVIIYTVTTGANFAVSFGYYLSFLLFLIFTKINIITFTNSNETASITTIGHYFYWFLIIILTISLAQASYMFAKDIFHISTNNYLSIRGQSKYELITRGAAITVQNHKFHLFYNNPYPILAEPQIQKIINSPYLEIKYYDNDKILEIIKIQE